MEKPQFSIERIQKESGKESGMYIFRNGLLMFIPISPEAVIRLAHGAIEGGMQHMSANVEALIDTLPAVPSPGEGAKGAGAKSK